MLHLVICLDHYRRGEYEDALTQVKRVEPSELRRHPDPDRRRGRPTAACHARRRPRSTDCGVIIQRTSIRTRPGPPWGVDLGRRALSTHLIDGFVKAKALDAARLAAIHRRASVCGHRTRRDSDSGKRPACSSTGAAPRSRVLPFTDMSAAKDQDWFCDGVAEEILNALSQLKDLRVAARASAFSFRGKGDDLKTIGDKLQVATVLDGSVRRSGDQLRITVRLSDVTNGYQLWSERYDRSLSDIFDVQEEIAKAVAARLSERCATTARRSRMSSGIRRIRRRITSTCVDGISGIRDPKARFSGRESSSRRHSERPNYVLPWVGLAELFAIQSLYGFEGRSTLIPALWRPEPRAGHQRQSGDAHRARGFSCCSASTTLRIRRPRPLNAASRSTPRAVSSHIWLGWPTWPGRDDVAIAAARRAQELDPLNPTSTVSPARFTTFMVAVERGFGIRQGLRD